MRVWTWPPRLERIADRANAPVIMSDGRHDGRAASAWETACFTSASTVTSFMT